MTQPPSARRRLLAAAGAAVFALALPAHAAGDDEALPLEAARDALARRSAIVFDIREPDEHARGAAPGMRLLPMSQIGQRLAEIPRDQPVILVCNTQNRSKATARALRERGWTNVHYAAGGMSEWARRGWPMVAPH
ncbi:MAG: rhodanese-like domain-containing protein [Rubrivivax sp.]